MDVRTQKNTLILLSDLSGFHVEDLHSLTKRFPSLQQSDSLPVEGQLGGRGPSLALVEVAAQQSWGASAQSPGGVTGLERAWQWS